MNTSNEVIGVGPSGRALKTLNNKNNLAGLYLRKKLAQYDREMNFSVSHIDREKFDTIDFLKNIWEIESDTHPAAVQYLGRDPTKTSYFHTIKRKPTKTVPILQHEFEDQCSTRTPNFNETRRAMLHPQSQQHVEEMSRPSHARTDTPSKKDNLSKKETPGTTLPYLDPRQSISLQVASVSKHPEQTECSNSDSDSDFMSPRHRRTSMRRRSFMAWVRDQRFELPNGQSGALFSQYAFQKLKPVEKRRQSFSRWLKAREILKGKTRREICDLQNDSRKHFERESQANPLAVSHNEFSTDGVESPSAKKAVKSFKNVGEIMRTVICLRAPVNDRITDFYDKIHDLKLDEKDKLETPWQQKRRLNLLSKSVKAALAESDDDDDGHDDGNSERQNKG